MHTPTYHTLSALNHKILCLATSAVCFQCLHRMQERQLIFFSLVEEGGKKNNKPTLSSMPMLPFGLGQSTEACFESFLLEHAGRRTRSVEIQDLPRTH